MPFPKTAAKPLRETPNPDTFNAPEPRWLIQKNLLLVRAFDNALLNGNEVDVVAEVTGTGDFKAALAAPMFMHGNANDHAARAVFHALGGDGQRRFNVEHGDEVGG